MQKTFFFILRTFLKNFTTLRNKMHQLKMFFSGIFAEKILISLFWNSILMQNVKYSDFLFFQTAMIGKKKLELSK